MKALFYMDFNFNKLCNVAPELQAWLKKWDEIILPRNIAGDPC